METKLRKCHVLSCTTNCYPIYFDYLLNNKLACEICNTVLCLGVIFDTRLTYLDHLHYVFKIWRILRYVWQTLVVLLINTAKEFGMNNLYLERVQHKGICFLPLMSGNSMYLFKHNYSEYAFKCNPNSLECCMNINDITFCHKIMKVLIHFSELYNGMSICRISRSWCSNEFTLLYQFYFRHGNLIISTGITINMNTKVQIKNKYNTHFQLNHPRMLSL